MCRGHRASGSSAGGTRGVATEHASHRPLSQQGHNSSEQHRHGPPRQQAPPPAPGAAASNIKVVVRIRPCSDSELAAGDHEILEVRLCPLPPQTRCLHARTYSHLVAPTPLPRKYSTACCPRVVPMSGGSGQGGGVSANSWLPLVLHGDHATAGATGLAHAHDDGGGAARHHAGARFRV